MNDWFTTLDGMHARAWQLLREGAAGKDHAARFATLATVSPDGAPEARTVALREIDESARTVAVFTDNQSDKMRSLAATPQVALNIWDHVSNLQVRIWADVTLQQGEPLRALWDRMPGPALYSYGSTPPPGQPISSALDYIKKPDFDCFLRILCKVSKMDIVHLGEDHRRAVFSQTRDWEGEWLAP